MPMITPAVVALIACTNCTHTATGDTACAACIADALRGLAIYEATGEAAYLHDPR